MAKKKPAKQKPLTEIAAVRHTATRKNIPTEELRDFVRPEDQHAPPLLYPRDASLDPQLVWRGKDQQDAAPLAVPVTPIYIQEKISPRAIIDGVLSSLPSPSGRGAGGEGLEQLDLFADFNGLPPEFDQRIDFYQHDGHWSNRMILGDSLLVMTSLAEKESLRGQVQTIYLDPPYGIKFGSNWQVSTRKRDVKDGKTTDATRQPEQVRAFRDTWELGIHSYLAYLRDRLVAARELLTDSGSVFVQIGDENVHLVRCVMDEVFGSENSCAQIVFRKTTGKGSQLLDNTFDVVLWFAKNKENVKYRALYEPRSIVDEDNLRFVELADGKRRRMTAGEITGQTELPADARVYRPNPLTNQRPAQGNDLRSFEFEGRRFTPGSGTFRTDLNGLNRLSIARRLLPVGSYLTFIRYLDDFAHKPRNDIWDDTRSGGYGEDKIYVVQTNSKVIERCLLMTTDPGDLVLDPTCGSGTTAYVAEQWGRRWITCDTSRVALALARTRLMAAKFPYYHLAADYPQITQISADEDIKATLRSHHPSPSGRGAGGEGAGGEGADIRKGFVYRRVPHVTLKSIANNPDIRPGMSRQEIDAAISRHAETETLFDQPYEDKSRVRVSGPFTVESLSPHRTISVDDRQQLTVEFDGPRPTKIIGPDKFGQMIIDNLRKAGVQNTVKGQRLKFDSLEPFPGEWIHAVGTYTEISPQMAQMGADEEETSKKSHQKNLRTSASSADNSPSEGIVRRAAVTIGPEFGTVEPALVKEAAKEAVRGVGFDVLIICGFAFDPHVSEEAKRYGNLVVLPCRMNPDLAMGDDLLKKTGAGNLFMVFGEPDIVIRRGYGPQMAQISADKDKKKSKDKDPVPGTPVPGTPHRRTSASSADKSPSEAPSADDSDEFITVEIRGLDVYDPTTGEIRSSSTDDVACWFIDTDYNGESFFVRHAYFTGADQPYEKLKRALRAEIDEDAWSQLYSTTSRPFPKPASGQIAVKVINHYGDEVLKVYEVK